MVVYNNRYAEVGVHNNLSKNDQDRCVEYLNK